MSTPDEPEPTPRQRAHAKALMKRAMNAVTKRAMKRLVAYTKPMHIETIVQDAAFLILQVVIDECPGPLIARILERLSGLESDAASPTMPGARIGAAGDEN